MHRALRCSIVYRAPDGCATPRAYQGEHGTVYDLQAELAMPPNQNGGKETVEEKLCFSSSTSRR
jgi:hypothetical protein